MKNYFKWCTVLLAVFLSLTVIKIQAEEDVEVRKNLKEQLPYLMGSNNAGTLFYLAFHPCWESNASNNALRIYISSSVATTVTMEIKGLGVFRQKMTIPNDVIDFTLPPSEGQPYTKSDMAPPLPEQVWVGNAIKITSEDPIICYGVTRFAQTSDGYLVLPASSLGTSYQVSSYADPTNNVGQWLTSYTSIIGVYDNTRATFKMGGCESCYALKENGEYLRFNQFIKRNLNEGDVWLIPGIGPFNDLTGSIVTATKPISVISGNFCAYIPSPTAYCDFIIEQEMPDNLWGKTYHVTPILTRKTYSIIKIFVKKPFTEVSRDGSPSWTINNPGGIIGNGFIEERANILGPGETIIQPVEISSNEPINVVQYNTGQSDDNVENDPFQMVLTPTEQYQNEIVFNTPGIRGQYGFKNNYVNIVYKATIDGGIPNEMMWAEVVDGKFKWTPMVTFSGNPGLRFFRTESDGRYYCSKSIKLGYDGVYRIKSNEPFAAYAYGSDNHDSYGFPTSVATSNLEVPDSLAPTVEFEKECGGNVVGKVTDEPDLDPENRSNLGLVFLASEDSKNYKFECDKFIAGFDGAVKWKLFIRNASLNAQAHLVFIDRVGNRKDTIIQHYAISPSISPYYSNYGTFKVENPNLEKTLQFTVKNEGDHAIGSMYSLYVILDSDIPEDKSGDIHSYQNFDLDEVKGQNLSPMAVGQSVKFNVKFTARQEGIFRDSVGIAVIDKSTGDTCVKQYFTLLEAFVGNPYITSSDKNFYQQVVNNRTPKYDLTITNPVTTEYKATTSLKITGVEFSGDEIGNTGSDDVFEVEGLENVSVANPIIIEPGKSRTFSVSFKPKAVQNYHSRITFIADANQPKNYSVIEGTGIQPDLLVNGDNWGERLVDPNSYIQDGGTHSYLPYLSPNGAIELSNNGTATVTLKIPEIISEINGSAFKYLPEGADPSKADSYISITKTGILATLFNNKPIKAGEKLHIPVYFDAKTEGAHELILNFPSDAADNRTSTLAGIGVFPKGETQNLDFGHKIVGTGLVNRNVDFKAVEWNFDYPVTITDFEIHTSNSSTTFTEMNGNGIFQWNRNNIYKNGNVNEVINLPVTLLPGEYLTISGIFEPTAAGSFEGTISTVSNAATEAVSVWTGTSETEGTLMTSASGATCRQSPIILRPKIKNLGSEELKVTNVYVRVNGSSSAEFKIQGETEFILSPAGEPNDEKEITVMFTPVDVYQNLEAKVYAETEAVTVPVDSTVITVSSSHTTQPSYSLVSIGGDKQGDSKNVRVNPGIGQAIGYTVFLNTTGGVPLAASQIFDIQIKYNKSFVGVSKISGTDNLKIDISPVMASLGWTIISSKVSAYDKNTNIETLTVSISNIKSSLFEDKGDIPLLHVSFDSYLDFYLDGTSNLEFHRDTVEFVHTIINNDACVDYTYETSKVSLNPTCMDDMRPIQVSAVRYGLESIAPNPVGSEGATVNFSVGGNNIFTEVKVYNSKSEIVATVFSGTLNPGKFSAHIPVEELSSGLYFIEMVSGPYKSGYQKFVISK